MKLLIPALTFLLLLAFVDAGTVQTVVNISITNETQQVIVHTDSNTITYPYSPSSNNSQVVTISYPDSSCVVTDNLTQTMRDFIKTQKVNGDYYMLYLGCYTDKATCTSQLQAQKDTTSSYKSKYDGFDSINQQNAQCQSNLQNCQSQASTRDASIGSCQTSLQNEKNNRIIWGGIGFAICAAIWWRTNASGKVQHPGQKAFPERR